MRTLVRGRGPGIRVTPPAETLLDDGSDQSAAWLQWLSTIADGTEGDPTTITLPGGEFRMDGGLKLWGRNHLRVEGPTAGDPFVATSTVIAQTGVDMRDCENVVVSNVRWEGPNVLRHTTHTSYARYVSAYEDKHAFYMSGCTDCGIEDSSYTNVYGDGFYAGFNLNTGCWVDGLTGTYAGRHGIALTNVDGIELTDVTAEWCGYDGVDIEPNGATDKVWNTTFTRVSVSSVLNPFVVGGATTGAAKRSNISLVDCEVIACPTAVAGLTASRSPNLGTLLVDGLVDHRNSTRYGLYLPAAWPTVTVRDCEVDTNGDPNPTYAVVSGCTGTLTIENNTFGGFGSVTGFDQLALLNTTPASYVHSGNVRSSGPTYD